MRPTSSYARDGRPSAKTCTSAGEALGGSVLYAVVDARGVAQALTAGLGQQVIVENRGGAGGAIAFETSQKAILTSCVLKSPASVDHPELRCCFSFTIQRDTHSM